MSKEKEEGFIIVVWTEKGRETGTHDTIGKAETVEEAIAISKDYISQKILILQLKEKDGDKLPHKEVSEKEREDYASKFGIRITISKETDLLSIKETAALLKASVEGTLLDLVPFETIEELSSYEYESHKQVGRSLSKFLDQEYRRIFGNKPKPLYIP